MLLGPVAHRKGVLRTSLSSGVTGFASSNENESVHLRPLGYGGQPSRWVASRSSRSRRQARKKVGGAGRNCTAVRERLSPDSTCVSASEISLTTSRSGQNRRQPAPVNLAAIGRGTPIATSPRKWHPFPARGPAGTDVEA